MTGVMTCPLEALPQEMLDTIVGFLSAPDIARLGECSEHLSRRLSRALYLTPEARNSALRWACIFDLPRVMRLAGAPLSTVDIPKVRRNHEQQGHQRTEGGTVRVLTLHLAAMASVPCAFKRLIRHGASIDDCEVSPRHLRAFVERLCARPHADFALPFLESGLASQLPKDMLNQLLLGLIKAGTTTDLVEQVLDLGADPNYLHRGHQKRQTMSPLAAAAVRGKPAIFQLLLERGAHGDGPRFDRAIKRPLHIPLYALAHAASSQDINAVVGGFQLCLSRAGANINHHAWVRPQFPRFIYPLLCTTPFFFYLNSIKSWEFEATARHEAVIQWFVDNGASVLPQQILQLKKIYRGHTARCVATPTPIELLLDYWGIESLTYRPGFLNMLKVLVVHGAAPTESIARLLSKYEYEKAPSDDSADDAIYASWHKFITFIANSEGPHSARPSQILRHYTIVLGAGFLPWAGRINVGTLTLRTMDALLAAGADINWNDNGQSRTALSELCWEDCKAGPSDSVWVVPRWAFDLWRSESPRTKLYRMILDRGANPRAKWEDQTATQILEQGWPTYSASGREFITSLVALIKGYEGSRGLVEAIGGLKT